MYAFNIFKMLFKLCEVSELQEELREAPSPDAFKQL